MAQAHDRAIFQPGRHLQAIRQAFAFHHQRMIAGSQERRRQALEHTFALVVHHAHLAMHDLVAAHDLATESLADGLVPKADTQQRDARLGCGNGQRQTDAGLCRIAGAGRQHDHFRAQGHGLLHIQRIIAQNADIGPKFAQIMDEIVGETVIIVDQQQHWAGPCREGR
ncbi:MAG: hypothetical protein A2092_18790 [Rhodobacteraceae bacterium GWE1_64_9]|nr:MAG: hypothetical protein A2092_18790 [Rhodobacteraceae bacterium GWE1_64_9]